MIQQIMNVNKYINFVAAEWCLNLEIFLLLINPRQYIAMRMNKDL